VTSSAERGEPGRGNRPLALALALGAMALAAGAGLFWPRAGRSPEAPAGVASSSAPIEPSPSPAVVSRGAAPAPAGGGKLVAIPAGTMGSEDGNGDERPVHDVKVAAFEIDATEVTVGQYQACADAGQCAPYDTAEWPGITRQQRDEQSRYCNWGEPERRNHPMNCVDWDMAHTYCLFAGKRLPTEEEWEYAARGSDGRSYPWGNEPAEPGKDDRVCWLRWDVSTKTGKGTCEVATHPSGRSPFGLYDMSGNVWEWTASPYCPYDQRRCKSDFHVLRGGCWGTTRLAYIRTTQRDRAVVSRRVSNAGFRCARGSVP
jgi:formylglycine-generating enzyme required for sulfatase activity